MSAKSDLESLKPNQRLLIMNLLAEAGLDVSDWKNVRNVPASANPKYCYNWSFEQPGEFVAVCLWYDGLHPSGGQIQHCLDRRRTGKPKSSQEIVWRMRREALDRHIQVAYSQQLPVRVIIVDGKQGDADDTHPKASRVTSRLLDPVPWAVAECDFSTGECLLVRGQEPRTPARTAADLEVSWFEGTSKEKFIIHRRREAKARREKIRQTLAAKDGKLVCEVPRCNFDFKARYGVMGEGYAQVHHLKPLSMAPLEGRRVKLEDLAIVCANCHVMIHVGGQCRPLDGLIRTRQVPRQ